MLERIQIIQGIEFECYDTDNTNDIAEITQSFIKPTVDATSEIKKEMIRSSLEFYCIYGDAPFQLMRDRCQDLNLPDPQNWKHFFLSIGKILFPTSFSPAKSNSEYQEQIDLESCSMIFTK